MGNYNRARPSSLFLMEIIFSILFFALVSSACVQIFAKAHTMSQDARNLNFAVIECSSAAEMLAESESRTDAVQLMSGYYSYAETENGTITVFFDDSFAECTEKDGTYVLTCSLSESGQMLNADIAVDTASGDEIYSLKTGHYMQEEVQP